MSVADPPTTSLTVRELEFLARVATGRRVLECGSGCGASAVAMARTALSVTTIDRHRDYPLDTLRHLRGMIAAQGLRGKIVPIVGAFEDTLPQLPRASFDVGFLDGSAAPEETRRYVEMMWDCLTCRAPVLIHDADSVNVGGVFSPKLIGGQYERILILGDLRA